MLQTEESRQRRGEKGRGLGGKTILEKREREMEKREKERERYGYEERERDGEIWR